MTRRAVRYAIRNHFSIDYHRPVRPSLPPSFFSLPFFVVPAELSRKKYFPAGARGFRYVRICESRFMKQRIFELQIKSARHGNEYRAPFHVSINFSIATRRNGKKKGGKGKTRAGRKQKQDKRTKKNRKDGPGPLLTRPNYFTWIRS